MTLYVKTVNFTDLNDRLTKTAKSVKLSIMKTEMQVSEKAFHLSKSPLPEIKPDLKEFLSPSNELKFVWLGHSTLLLNLDGKILLVDPVFSEFASPLDIFFKKFQTQSLSLEELPAIDAIIISHDDYDHLDKSTIAHFRNQSTGFIVPKGVAGTLHNWGIPHSRICELELNESVTHNGITFTTAPVKQSSNSGLFGCQKTMFVSWIIQGMTQKIFYSCDSGYGDHFKDIGDTHGPFDVTFIENGQYDDSWRDLHMRPIETIQAHLDLNGNLLVPIHWGVVDLANHHLNDSIIETETIAMNWEIPVHVPKTGEINTLDRLFNTLNYHSR